MTTTVGASTSYPLTIPELSETADIQTAIKLISYGQSADPTNNADIEANSLAGYLLSKANLSAPTFTGTLSIAGQNSQYPTSLALAEATHATSRRTSIQLGLGWQIGQDSVGDGTKNFYIYQTSTQLNPFTISSTNNITIGATGYTTTFVGNVTIPTIISNTINATSATTTGASLYPNITTGTMAIGAGLTTGTLNIATASAGAKTINIGTSTGTVNFNSSINTAGIVRPNATSSAGSISLTAGSNTSNGSGGSVSITAGSYTASGSAGNVSINAGGGPSNGTVSIQGAQGNTGDIYLGNFGSTTAVGGDFAVGGNIGVDGLFVDFYGNVTTGGTITSTGTITTDANITSSGKSSGPTESNVGYHLNQAGYIIATRNNGTPMYSSVTGASGLEVMMQFLYNGSENGRIRVDSGALPAFATASDYRVKTDITPITNAIERMKNAKAYTFHKINEVDPSNNLHTGFIAHELALVQPDAVVGEKNAVDAAGNPIYQEVMEAKLIPVMAQAINDLIGIVEKLSAEIEQLKN